MPLDTPQYPYFVTPPIQIFGPEIGLARQIWEDTGQFVTIDKFAYPDQPITQWDPSTANGTFDQLVTSVDKTMATDATYGQLDTIGAFYWYQGESDALDPTLYPEYQANLTALLTALRTSLPISPSAPSCWSRSLWPN